MKKFMLSFVVIFIAVLSSLGQIIVRDLDDNDISGGSMLLPSDGKNAYFRLENTSGVDMYVQFEAVELIIPADVLGIAACWFNCYEVQKLGNIFPSVPDPSNLEAYKIAANSISLEKADVVIAVATPTTQRTLLKIKFFDIANPSTNTTVSFDSQYNNINSQDVLSDDINVYPNPAKNQVNIRCSEENINNSYLIIYNILGEEIDKVSIQNSQTIFDISHLQSGVYLYSLVCDGEVLRTRKLFIK